MTVEWKEENAVVVYVKGLRIMYFPGFRLASGLS